MPVLQLLLRFNGGEETFQAIELGLLRLAFEIQNLAQVFDTIGYCTDGFREERASSVGVAAALEPLRDFQGLAVMAAEAGKNEIAAPKERNEDRIFCGFFLEQLMDD